jgi:predicted MFS family arabinose efflux permease
MVKTTQQTQSRCNPVLFPYHHATSSEYISSVIGLAGVLGALTAPLLRRRLSFFAIVISTLWAEALLPFFLILAPNLLLLGIVLALLFFLFPIFDVLQRSQRMALLPDALQGRVNSVYRLVVFSCRTASMALAGFLLQNGGMTLTILLIAGGLTLNALSATLNPHMRRADAETALE